MHDFSKSRLLATWRFLLRLNARRSTIHAPRTLLQLLIPPLAIDLHAHIPPRPSRRSRRARHGARPQTVLQAELPSQRTTLDTLRESSSATQSPSLHSLSHPRTPSARRTTASTPNTRSDTPSREGAATNRAPFFAGVSRAPESGGAAGTRAPARAPRIPRRRDVGAPWRLRRRRRSQAEECALIRRERNVRRGVRLHVEGAKVGSDVEGEEKLESEEQICGVGTVGNLRPFQLVSNGTIFRAQLRASILQPVR